MNPFFKAFCLVFFLLSLLFNVQIFAQNQTTITLKNNTDARAIFCINNTYQGTIAPNTSLVSEIPTGDNKIDMILVGPSLTVNSCTIDSAIVDENGLPSKDTYLDTFFDYEDYFFTVNQTIKPVTTTNTTYTLNSGIATQGVTAIDLGNIATNDNYQNNKLCVDGLLIPVSTGNLVVTTPGLHRFSLLSSSNINCEIDTSVPETNVSADTTYQYNPQINSNTVNVYSYQSITEFKTKPIIERVIPDSSVPAASTSSSNPSAVQVNLSESIPKKDELIPTKSPSINTESIQPDTSITPLIKYDKLKIDRAAVDKIDDEVENSNNNETNNISSTTKNYVINSKIEWYKILFMTFVVYMIFDVLIYVYKKNIHHPERLKSPLVGKL